jgi:hypothetical protein
VDCLRRQIWSNPQVDWWYAQNALFFGDRTYVASHSQLSEVQRTGTPDGLGLIHPRHYLDKARRANIGLAEVIKMLPRLVREAFARRVRRWSDRGSAVN